MQEPDTTELSQIIRRTLRVIGSQPSHVSSPLSTAAVARLVSSRLTRAGVPVEWVEGEHGTPLVIAGRGPVVVSSYLDDIHPDAIQAATSMLDIQESHVVGCGLERKASIVAHMAALLADPSLAERVTMIFETDRHAGSHTLEKWLATNAGRYSSVAWEVSDLPLAAPVVVRAATGTVILEIRMDARRSMVEPVYGTVLPDIGIAMSSLIVSLKSSDEEVKIDGFYDGISSLDEADIDAVSSLGPGVSRWLVRFAGDERNLSTSHMTLGMFCAPSLIVRRVNLDATGDYLPESASAIVEFQLIPGQQVDRIINAVRSHVATTPFEVQVTPLLVRAPVGAGTPLQIESETAVIPIAPGPSPASIYAGHGIAGSGYALVGRTPSTSDDGIRFDAIAAGTTFLTELIDVLGTGGARQP